MTDAFDPSTVSDFDFEKSTAEAWASFEERLADVLSVMEDDATLRIGAVATETAGVPPFVLFRAIDGRRLRAQASGNDQVDPAFKMTTAQQDDLVARGWTPLGTPERGFFREASQEDAPELAARAGDALRDIFQVPHPAFLAPDQLAEILTPPAKAELPAQVIPAFQPEQLVAVMPESRDHLDRLVGATLAAALGHAPMQDADGDFGIRVGSTMVFVRTSADGREVLVFSVLVHDVEGRSRAMEVLSDLNTDARFVRFILVRDRVFLSLSVYAQPFVPAHLRQALELVSLTSDAIDNDLAAKLRGRTTFTDDEPRPPQN